MPSAERAFPSIPGQQGLARVDQLLATGWSPAALRHARATSWQEPLPRVLAPHRGPLDGATRLVAAALWAGPRAVLTGGLALTRLGLGVRRTHQVTFLVPVHARARRQGGVQTVRTSRPPDVATRSGPLVVATAARAMADAAVHERHTPGELEHLAIAVLQRGLATAEELERKLHHRPRAQVGPVWRGRQAFAHGAWSRPERVLREVVERAGDLPPLLTSVPLHTHPGGVFLGTPDGYLAEAGLVIQVHSREFHQGTGAHGDRWQRTVERDSGYVAAGLRVIAVTPWTLCTQPGRFQRTLRQAVESARELPPPAVRAGHARSA